MFWSCVELRNLRQLIIVSPSTIKKRNLKILYKRYGQKHTIGLLPELHLSSYITQLDPGHLMGRESYILKHTNNLMCNMIITKRKEKKRKDNACTSYRHNCEPVVQMLNTTNCVEAWGFMPPFYSLVYDARPPWEPRDADLDPTPLGWEV